jgi:hypothetical protein
VKRVLVSLVDAKDPQLARLHRGIEYAARTGTSLRDVIAWKQAEFPQLAGTRGRPRGLSVAGGQRFLQTGVQLGSERERRAFAGKVKEAPAPLRRAFVKDLEKTIENLRKLRDEVGS